MAEFATIARPYAKALFSLAQEKNQIESWLGELKELAAVVQDEKVIAFIEQPETGASEKAETLKGLVGIKNVELANFITVFGRAKAFAGIAGNLCPISRFDLDTQQYEIGSNLQRV